MGAHISREAVTVAGKKWQCLSEIGEGRYAKIFMVKDLQDDQVYVVKRTLAQKIDKPVSQQSREEKEEAMKIQSAVFEPHVLKALHPEYEVQAEDGTTRREKFHHPNIVNFHEFKKRKSKDNKQYEFLLRLECCPGGNLKQQLQLAGRQPWPIVAIMQCFSDICNAVAFLHQQNPPLAHRDLKLSNVLIDSSQNYKLCDFGSSSNEVWNLSPMVAEKDIPHKIADMAHFVEIQTTESYRAPEMLDLAKYKHVGVEADIWALGCILYELLFLKAPFGRPNDSQDALKEQQRNIKVAAFDIPSWASNYPKPVLNLLRAMLVADYRKRAKITDIVKAVRKILVEETRLVSNDVRPPRMQSRQPEGISSATNSPSVGQAGQPAAAHPSIFSRDLAKATTSRKLEAPKAKHMRRLIIAAWQQDDPVRACGALFAEICGNRSSLTDVTVAYKTLITIHKLIQQGPPEILHECFRVRQFLQRIQFLSRSEGGKTFSRNETGSDVVSQTMQLYAAYLIQRANFHHDHPTIEGNFSIACHLYDIQREDVQFSLDEWKEMARRAVEQMLKFLELLAQVGDRAMSAGAGSDKTLVDFRQSVVPPIVDDMYAIYLTVTYFLGLLRVVVGLKPVEELVKQYKRHFGMIRDFYATALQQCSQDVINAKRLPPLPSAALKISSRTTVAESTVVPLPSNVPNLAQMNMPLCDKFKKQLIQAGSARRTHSRANSEFSDLDPLGPQKRTTRAHHMEALRVDSPRVQTSSQNLGVREVRRTQTDPTRQRAGSGHAHHADAHHQNAYRQQQRAQTQRSTADNFLAFANDNAHHHPAHSPGVAGGGGHGQQARGSRGSRLPLPQYDQIKEPPRAYTDPLGHRDAAARGRAAGYGQKSPVARFPGEEQSSRQEEAFKVFDDPEFNASFEQMASNTHSQRRNHAEYDAPSSVWHPNFPAENAAGDEQKGGGGYGGGGSHRRTDGGSMLASTSVERDEHDEALVHLDSDDDELVWEDLELQDRIGIGGFAEVFKGRWLGADVAIKKLINQRQTPESLDEFRSEVAIMRRMQHPNITMFMGACTVPPNMCLVTELLEMSLFDLLHNTSIPLSWRIKAKIALGTARGLDFLHNCDPPILHRDLKSANILLDKHFEPRLADFGLSREKVMSTMTAQTGTFQWMSPEVIAGKRYTEKADVFSYGIILWELCVRKIPYEGKTGFQVSFDVVQNKARPEIDYDLCPPNWIKLMTNCWKETSEDRPSFERVVRIVKEMQLSYENA